MGKLSSDSHEYSFTYLPGAAAVEGFRPFIAFPEFNRQYQSARLWAFFALRTMDPHRPDYLRYLTWLGLESGADPLDVLSRSGGERKGDSVQLVERPAIAPGGSTSSVFLARGARYATRQHGSAPSVDALREGDPLRIKTDTGNPANPRALYLTDRIGSPFAWVPDLLIRYVEALVSKGGELKVLRNNGPECPWHLRVLVSAHGSLPPNCEPFPEEEDAAPTLV
ncbi:hypothetical protein QOZ88_22935 [Blastococcus sp. BMG 814]|uniref:HIRAN domain-containing protein n=1 Tax=Blastococcus carthaginiensis TaxID=3050034 RepID=A0ABT9IK33_9ACTN|nr:hypothetical protein [Blastococcus carthaginiensis]MDP5185499.1 hypothetical protein [Blastococcus carthaginiensis]